MENKKVSIIVPIYNVENYLEECLNSLINQTYHNLEIILIDDGSTDGCPQLCDTYKKKDSRVKVIHKKNGGAASARNAGLDSVTGEYIAFVDGDDYVSSNYISDLLKDLEDVQADISVCAYKNLYKDREDDIALEKEGIYSQIDFLERFLWDWKCGLIWNKIFRAELIEKIRFAEGHVIDDEYFTYKIVMNAKKISVKDKKLYYYRMRKSGVMNKGKHKQMLLDRIGYFQERFELVTEKYPELYVIYLNNLADNLITMKREAESYSDVYFLVKKIQKKYLFKILLSSLNYKAKYSFIRTLFIREKRIFEKNNLSEVENYFD